jgi:hypothetical protein
MIRVAAQPEPPEDHFGDIWENSRSGRNPDAEQWLNNRVRYERPDTAYPENLRPHDWIGRPQENLPNGGLQYEETNRDIDDSHARFEQAYRNGLQNVLDPGQYNPGGQAEPQPYDPTSPERLASDEGWLLGPGRQFDYPGGRDAIEAVHNGMHQRGFDLGNAGTDEEPIPSYMHRDTQATITPNGDGWRMHTPGGGVTDHAGPSSAAALHQQNMEDRNAAEAARYQSVSHRERNPEEYSTRSTQTGRSDGPRRREAHDYIPKTKAQKMSWGNLFDEAVNGDEGFGREFERASVKSVHNPYRGDTGRLYGVHRDQWNQDFDNDAAGRGKVAQAIYHYATPIAWKYHNVQPGGTYDDGQWRMPATSFGSGGFFSTGKVQKLLGPSLWRSPGYSHTRDPLVDINLHRRMEQDGLHRQDDQTYQGTDAFGNTHHVAPSQSGRTAVHTVTSPGGESTWTKRVPAHEAADNFYSMGLDSQSLPQIRNPAEYLKSQKYRGSGAAASTPARRRDVPLRLQPELPFRSSSVASWAEFLRD